ncbi:hypothetical protein FM107_19690 [Sphingobacterium sp. JB170]|nr:hypothetical protein FM107_19690 [Sphingobacterium sp. JB170]
MLNSFKRKIQRPTDLIRFTEGEGSAVTQVMPIKWLANVIN